MVTVKLNNLEYNINVSNSTRGFDKYGQIKDSNVQIHLSIVIK